MQTTAEGGIRIIPTHGISHPMSVMVNEVPSDNKTSLLLGRSLAIDLLADGKII